jgi:hypothetical protein
MPNATERATAPAMPKATNRRAVLGAVLAAGAIGATAVLPVYAASGPAPLSAVDRRVLDLWNRRRRLVTALDRLSERIDTAEAQMPEWARSGPKYVLAKGEIQTPGVTTPPATLDGLKSPTSNSSPSALLDGSSPGERRGPIRPI